MSYSEQNIAEMMKCTCIDNNSDLELCDLNDADFHDVLCPVHGKEFKIKE